MKIKNSWLIIGLILFIVFVYTFSGGKVDVGEKIEKDNGKKSNDSLKVRYEKLKKLVEAKKTLYKKLTKKFKWIYFGVRLSLLGIFTSYCLMLYHGFGVTNLGELLNWIEVVAIIVVFFSFLAFGTFSNVREYVEKLKMRIEIMVFKKHFNLLNDVDGHENELLQIANNMNPIEGSDSAKPLDSAKI